MAYSGIYKKSLHPPQILCLGIFDVQFNVILHFLLRRKKGRNIISAGTDVHADREIPPNDSVTEIVKDLGFAIYKQQTPHPNFIHEAKENGLVPAWYCSTHVNSINIESAHEIWTVHELVRDDLESNGKKVTFIDGISYETSYEEALETMRNRIM